MANPVKKPWAILLCRYSDDRNDPAQTTIADLYQQWEQTHDAVWMANNITPNAAIDTRTILELYQNFFTITGLFTFNVVRYFDEMSHGLIDVSDSQVFPCTLDITIAEGRNLETVPGGTAFQEEMFKKSKTALANQHGIDWKDFYGVIVSFQSDIASGQGGWFDNGPGVIADIRFVRNGGTNVWGHEMCHGFGLGHSRTDGQFTSNCTGGDPADYTDDWDIMSAVGCAIQTRDETYEFRGPGLNAWNMRAINGLDEDRIWKRTANSDFSELIVLQPLHWRNRAGYLGAELPGIGNHSPYLIEFRVAEFWDGNFVQPCVIVHRHENNQAVFMDNNSFIMKGTKGQKILLAGDVFESGKGPLSRVKVVAIDAVNSTATVQLCYSSKPVVKPSVKIALRRNWFLDPCSPLTPVEFSPSEFIFHLKNVVCKRDYQVMWHVTGSSPLAGESNSDSSFSIMTPAQGISVTISVSITFEDGSSINDSYTFQSLSQAAADWIYFLCKLTRERKLPNSWWQWDPAKDTGINKIYSLKELQVIEERTEMILQGVRQLMKTSK